MPDVGACHGKYFTLIVFMLHVGGTLHFKVFFNGIVLFVVRHCSFFYFPNFSCMVLIFYTWLAFHLKKFFKGIAFFAVVHCSFFPLIYKFFLLEDLRHPKSCPRCYSTNKHYT